MADVVQPPDEGRNEGRPRLGRQERLEVTERVNKRLEARDVPQELWDAFKDAWFIGFTDKVTCGVWAGLDQPATIAYGAYGGNVALPVWTDVMLACEREGYRAGALNTIVVPPPRSNGLG